MPVTAETYSKKAVEEFTRPDGGYDIGGDEGADAQPLKDLFDIISRHMRDFAKAVRRETLASAAATAEAAEPEKPQVKKMTNYTLFGMDFRERNPKIASDKMFKEIGKAWDKLSDAQKEEWKVKAKAENERLCEEYRKEHGEDPPKRVRRKKGPKTTHAFRVFVADFRKRNPKVDHKKVFGEASKEWNKLSAAKKKPFEQEAERLREQYKAEWEEEQKNLPQPIKQKKEKKLRPAVKSAYIYYQSHWRNNNDTSKMNGQDAIRAVAAAWQKLPKKERTKFETQATKENARIVEEFVKANPDCEWTQNHKKKVQAAN